jgi:hypothetical protein
MMHAFIEQNGMSQQFEQYLKKKESELIDLSTLSSKEGDNFKRSLDILINTAENIENISEQDAHTMKLNGQLAELQEQLGRVESAKFELERNTSNYHKQRNGLLKEAYQSIGSIIDIASNEVQDPVDGQSIDNIENNLVKIFDEVFWNSEASNSTPRSALRNLEVKQRNSMVSQLQQVSSDLSYVHRKELLEIFKEFQKRVLIIQLQRDNAIAAHNQYKSYASGEIERLSHECHTLREAVVDIWDGKTSTRKGHK